MPVETRAQAAKMDEQVKHIWTRKWAQWVNKEEIGARIEEMNEKMNATNKEMGENIDTRMVQMGASMEEMNQKMKITKGSGNKQE